MELKHETWIEATIENAYRAIGTKDGLQGWWTSDTEFNPKERTLKFGFMNKYWMKFKILNTDINKSVEWECIDADEQSKDWLKTKITFNLETEDNNTIVKMRHSNWNDKSPIIGRCNTTWGHLMYSLKDYVETGEGEPMS